MDASRSLREEVKVQSHTSHGSFSTIMSLPKDMLVVEVFSRVASDSLVDLCNLKKSCKHFLDAVEDKYIYQHVSLDKLPLFPWHPHIKAKQSLFLKRCRESGNIESLFREGFLEFNKKGNSGLEILREVSEKGHKEAKYMYAMAMLCCGDEEKRKEGLMDMRFLRRSKCVISCRERVKLLASDCRLRKHKEVVRTPKPLCHHPPRKCTGWRVHQGWPLLNDEEDHIPCEYCRFDHELDCFCAIFDTDFASP